MHAVPSPLVKDHMGRIMISISLRRRFKGTLNRAIPATEVSDNTIQ